MKVNQSKTVLVSVGNFEGNADKNGNMPVYLTALNGTLPNRARVLSGTVANRAGLTPGTTALIQLSRIEDNAEYGEQYRHVMIQKSTSIVDTINAQVALGGATVSVQSNVTTESSIVEEVEEKEVTSEPNFEGAE